MSRPKEFDLPGLPLSAFRSSPEFHHSGAVAFDTLSGSSSNYLPCGLIPFGVFPTAGSHLIPGVTNPRFRCLHSVSHAPKAFIRPLSPGLISCRSRPWGFSLQGRFPHADRFVLSNVPTLLRLALLTATVRDQLRDDLTPRTSSIVSRANPFWHGASFESPRFRVFIPACVRFLRSVFNPNAEPRPSWALPP